MNWDALNELLIARRRIRQVLRYRKAVPGIMQCAHAALMYRAMGPDAWHRLLFITVTLSTELLEAKLQTINKEIDYRLDRFYLPVLS